MPNNFPTQQDYFYPKKYCLTKNNKKSQQKLQNIQINWNKRKQHKSMEPKISKNNAKHWKKWLNCREMFEKLLQKKLLNLRGKCQQIQTQSIEFIFCGGLELALGVSWRHSPVTQLLNYLSWKAKEIFICFFSYWFFGGT